MKTLNCRKRAKTEGTRKSYQTDWTRFEAWCESHSLPSIPAAPETVALYLSNHAETHKLATLARWLASISIAHKLRRLDSPTRSLVMSGRMPRVTFCVLAAEAGEEERRIQRVTGHKSTVMLRRYMKQGSIEKDSAVVNF